MGRKNYCARAFFGSVLFGLVVAGVPEAHARDYLVVFGDSNADPGNRGCANPPTCVPTLSRPPTPYLDGRFSNGPTGAELLPARLGITDTTRVMNFAVGGATTGALPGPVTNRVAERDLPRQVNRFLGVGLPQDFTPGPRPPANNTLILIKLGGNDFGLKGTTIASADDPDCSSRILAPNGCWDVHSIANLSTQIGNLVGAGYTEFAVDSLGDFGLVPGYAGRAATCEALGYDGVDDACNAVSSVIGRLAEWTRLRELIRLESTLGINIRLLESGGPFIRSIADNPTMYGITNARDPYRGIPFSCGGTETPPATGANVAEYIFFDCVHLTARVHELWAEDAAETLAAPKVPLATMEAALRAEIEALIAPQTQMFSFLGDAFLDMGQAFLRDTHARLREDTKAVEGVHLAYISQNLMHEGASSGVLFDNSLNGVSLSAGTIIPLEDSGAISSVALVATLDFIFGSAESESANALAFDTSAQTISLSVLAEMPAYSLTGFGLLSYGRAQYDMSRQNALTGSRITGDTNASAFRFGLGARHTRALPVEGLRLLSDAVLFGQTGSVDKYSESGPIPLTLDVDKQDVKSLQLHAGAGLAYAWQTPSILFTPSLYLSYRREFLDDTRRIRTDAPNISAAALEIIGGAEALSVRTPERDKNIAAADLSLGMNFKNNLRADVRLLVTFGNDNTELRNIGVRFSLPFSFFAEGKPPGEDAPNALKQANLGRYTALERGRGGW